MLLVPDSIVEKCVEKVCCCCFKTAKEEKVDKIELNKVEEKVNVNEDKPNGHLNTERSKTLWTIANKRIQTQVITAENSC